MLCLLRYVLLCWKCWVDGLHVQALRRKLFKELKQQTPETLQDVHKTNQNKACNFHSECFDEHLYFGLFLYKKKPSNKDQINVKLVCQIYAQKRIFIVSKHNKKKTETKSLFVSFHFE